MAKSPTKLIVWLREEARATERRTPLLPDGAKQLIESGIDVVVEKSEKRIIGNARYAEVGCTLAEAGAWETAPKEAVILGLKELPKKPDALKHTHVYFAHAFKDQTGWQTTLTRFQRGGGALLDIEYMTRADGKRVVAFGYWAGYMGAALALLQWQDHKAKRQSYIGGDLSPFKSAETLNTLISNRSEGMQTPTALVIGASGRSGIGAVEILERHGVKVTQWGRKETANLDRGAILDHDILINCAFVEGTIPPFLKREHIKPGNRLQVISDVSCDPLSDFNPLPLYSAPTSWETPAISIEGTLDLIAVDNLPSLLPTEASIEFAEMLLPYLKTLGDRDTDPVWTACDASYRQACDTMTKSEGA